MSDEKDDDLLQQGLTHLVAQNEATGVGTLKFRDGEWFLFSEHVLEMLLEKARSSPQRRAMVFVKNGPVVGKATQT